MAADRAASAPRVAIRTLGCKVNRTESEALAEGLVGVGVELAEEAGADLIVVNTCTVTGEADAKARKEVRRALAATSGPVVVTGCLAALDPDGLRALDPRVVAAGRESVAEAVLRALGDAPPARGEGAPEGSVCRPSDPEAAALPVPDRAGDAFRTRVMVKVQDGCDHRCSYCIVPDARGNPHSVPAGDVVARVRALARAGTAEVVLTGINIGRYADAGAGVTDLGGLLDALAVTGVRRVRISSIEPLDLTSAFARALSAHAGTVMPHLHVPLQSGCDRTLAEMGRGYTSADFARALACVRAAVPGLAVTTDVIVGFPGETDEDFASSLAFVEACGFSRLHVFRYSRRAGTPAAARADQVPPKVIAGRAAAMRALSEQLAAAHLRARDGQPAEVLVERVACGTGVGTTEDGLRVRIPGFAGRPGAAARVTLRLVPDGTMAGDLPEVPPVTPAPRGAGSM